MLKDSDKVHKSIYIKKIMEQTIKLTHTVNKINSSDEMISI